MQGTNLGQHHRAAGVAAIAAAFLALAPAGAASRIPLPVPPPPSSLSLSNEAGEKNKAPGEIADDEVVGVSLAADGSVAGVSVDQTLTLHGLGDFRLRIPGPATDVTGRPDAPVQPGLQRGSIIWQGFSPGNRVLFAHATLDPAFEVSRLPFAIDIAVHAQQKHAPYDGPITIEVTFTNNTAQPEPIYTGEPNPAQLRDLLRRLAAALSAGKAPLAGTGGIPSYLDGVAGAQTTREVPSRLRVRGGISFGSGTLTGGGVRTFSSGALFGSLRFSLQGIAHALGDPRIFARVEPSLPPPPPENGSFRLAQTVMWQVIRARQETSYLGNPGVGPSKAVFLVRPARAVSIVPRRRERARPFAIALALLAAAGVIANAGVVWRRS